VGQTANVTFWIDQAPPTATANGGGRWVGLIATITKPDGTVEKIGPFISDASGGASVHYVPTQIGTYTLVFDFPEQLATLNNPYSGAAGVPSDYVNDTFLASRAITHLTVQQAPVFSDMPTPTATPQNSTSPNLSGSINSDTTWTKANSPYALTGAVTVDAGTLTIGVGVTVNLNGYTLQVNGPTEHSGLLNAVGSNSDPIRLNGGKIAFKGSKSVIEKAILTSTSIQVTGAAPRIVNCTILGSNSGTGISCGGADSTFISGNFISGWATGILTGTGDYFFADGHPVIEKNVITGNGDGIGIGLFVRTWMGHDWPSIQNNTISGNSVGISMRIGYYETPGGNEWVLPTMVIRNNNIHGNTVNVAGDGHATVDVTQNWWGTADESAINQTFSGKVKFVPYLTEPYSGESTPVSPIPTPAPIDYCQIGVPYKAANGITVTVTNLQVLEKDGSYKYMLNYTLRNDNWGETIGEGWFEVRSLDGSMRLTQSGAFWNMAPGDVFTRSYQFLVGTQPVYEVLEYLPNSASGEKQNLPLLWKIENSSETLPSDGSESLNKPTLDVTCRSSTSYSDFRVEITGSLTINGQALNDVPVLLSYSVNGGVSWVDLTRVNTDINGDFTVVWLPSVTGNNLLKVRYAGNSTYAQVVIVVSFAVTAFESESVFSVASNSTVSGLTFNSEAKELSFAVDGESGTAGYVNLYVPKTLLNDASGLKVYLDGNELDFSYALQGESWLISFTYQHSTHAVIVNLGSTPSSPVQSPVGEWIVISLAFTAIMVAVAAVLFAFKRLREQKLKPRTA
jgi:hypothetical protein